MTEDAADEQSGCSGSDTAAPSDQWNDGGVLTDEYLVVGLVEGIV